MILAHVNILSYAFREDAAHHRLFRTWLDTEIARPERFGVADIVLNGFVRVATHPRIFQPPSPLEEALEFCRSLREQPNAVRITPGRRHWEIFTALCTEANARGELAADAFLAALAI